MFDEELTRFLDDRLARGQRRFADLTRHLVYNLAPCLLDKLDFENDDVFLEPLLFAYFNTQRTHVTLEQILFSYLRADYHASTFSVGSDTAGMVYLPRVGYLRTGRPNQTFTFMRSENASRYLLGELGTTFDCACEEAWWVAGGAIEVLRYPHPLLEPLYANRQGKVTDIEVTDIARTQVANLAVAFQIIESFCPSYYRNILQGTSKINIFSSRSMNSFAALRAHGMAFLNSSRIDDEVFFIEDIAHQCGHIAFSAITSDASEILAVSPNMSLATVLGSAEERRTVYEALHGLFTEAAMFHCLSECYRRHLFGGRQQHELIGRLGFIVRRFGSDLSNLSRGKLFTDQGEWLFAKIAAIFKCAYGEFWDRIRNLDFSNQLYNFNYERFAELNKL
jgi:hypothetical protein